MLKRLEETLIQEPLLPEHGIYIVAGSGGGDSGVLVVLLDRLKRKRGWKLIVAHLDHAQRTSSTEDAAFVGSLADRYGYKYLLGVLPFKILYLF